MAKQALSRSAVALALLLSSGLVAPAAAPGDSPRLYFTIAVGRGAFDPPQEVPVREFATVGGTGQERLGEPIVLSTRSGLNPRQEWWATRACYPCGFGILAPRASSPDRVRYNHQYDEFRFKLVSRYRGKCLGIHGDSRSVTLGRCGTFARHQVWALWVPKDSAWPPLSPTQVVNPSTRATAKLCLRVWSRALGTELHVLPQCLDHTRWLIRLAFRDHRSPPTFAS